MPLTAKRTSLPARTGLERCDRIVAMSSALHGVSMKMISLG